MPLLALSACRRASVAAAAVSYDADTLAYVATFSADPGAAYKNALDAFIVGVKADGVWDILDWLSDLEAPEQAPSLTNIKNLAQSLSAVGTVGSQITYTAGGGWKGDGSNGYLTFGVTFDSLTNFSQDSASVGAWCNLEGAGSGAKVHVGDLNSPSSRVALNAANGGANGSFRMNDATSSSNSTPSSSRLGHRTIVRAVSTDKVYYKAGSAVATVSVNSTGVASGNGTLLNATTGGFCDDQLAFAYVGGALDATQVANLHTRLNTFLTARGSA